MLRIKISLVIVFVLASFAFVPFVRYVIGPPDTIMAVGALAAAFSFGSVVFNAALYVVRSLRSDLD